MADFSMMCGIAGIGKSTLAEKLRYRTGHTLVSMDQIRGELCGDVADQSRNNEVFALTCRRIDECVRNEESIIYDATNLTRQQRKAILAHIPKDWYRAIYVFPDDALVALERQKQRERQVPEGVILDMAKRFVPPEWDEGWDVMLEVML